MDSVVRSHHVYKKEWLPVIGEQLILEKEPASPRHEFVVALIKDFQIGGHILNVYSQITWHFITQRGSVVCHITGRRRKGKGLWMYHVNILIIVNLQKTWHLFETQHLFLV